MGKGFGWLRRSIYLVVGATGFFALGWLITHWSVFSNMGFIGIFSFIVLMIGGINWTPVVYTNDGNKDLLHLVGLRK